MESHEEEPSEEELLALIDDIAVGEEAEDEELEDLDLEETKDEAVVGDGSWDALEDVEEPEVAPEEESFDDDDGYGNW